MISPDLLREDSLSCSEHVASTGLEFWLYQIPKCLSISSGVAE